MYGIYVVMVYELVKLLTTVRKLTHEAAHNSLQTCSQAEHSTQKDRLYLFMPIHITSS